MNAIELGILLPAFAAGLLVTATHVPLGIQVLGRGIVFIDLAIAQVAGLGVIFADWLGMEHLGWGVQAAALTAALAGALFLTWTERRWPEVQEAVIGTTFVLGASGALLLLAANPHGAEHLKDLLVGQILWVDWKRLALVAVVYAVILALWFGVRERIGRIGFYLLFAAAVTLSVQLVGLYLVFASLIVPALATHRLQRGRLAACYALSASGYALGLIASAALDLPSGAVIVWAMALIAVPVFLFGGRSNMAVSR
ncbi:MAG TPA: metal ABC transporter permease [Burkholderiales bacterium]|nr:metal ABC transporter permease [Burkholderiales bacterium]